MGTGRDYIGTVDLLLEKVEELEKRVLALEKQAGVSVDTIAQFETDVAGQIVDVIHAVDGLLFYLQQVPRQLSKEEMQNEDCFEGEGVDLVSERKKRAVRLLELLRQHRDTIRGELREVDDEMKSKFERMIEELCTTLPHYLTVGDEATYSILWDVVELASEYEQSLGWKIEGIEADLPLELWGEDNKALKAMKKAYEIGLVKKEGGMYRWTGKITLLAYFMGRLFCGDYIEKNTAGKEVLKGGGRILPESSIGSFFNVGRISKYRTDRMGEALTRGAEALENEILKPLGI